MNLGRLAHDIKQEEGRVMIHGRHVVFDDRDGRPANGKGTLTIGYGRNLETSGISESEAELLFLHDLEECISFTETLVSVDAWENMGDVRQEVLVQMVYQLGAHGVRKFRKMIEALNRRDYSTAAACMVDSLWYTQTPKRVHRLKERMLTGVHE